MKPCPFCQCPNDGAIYNWDAMGKPMYSVMCLQCGAKGSVQVTQDDARECWNDRRLPELPAVETAAEWFEKKIAELENDPDEMADLRRMILDTSPVEAETCEYILYEVKSQGYWRSCDGDSSDLPESGLCVGCNKPITIKSGGE